MENWGIEERKNRCSEGRKNSSGNVGEAREMQVREVCGGEGRGMNRKLREWK